MSGHRAKLIYPHWNVSMDKVFSKYRNKHRSKELTSSANTRDDKQDTANFYWMSKSESVWEGCGYVKGVGDWKGQQIDSENAKLIIILENSRNMKCELLSEVKFQKLEPTCLFSKQINDALECVGRELPRPFYISSKFIVMFLKL